MPRRPGKRVRARSELGYGVEGEVRVRSRGWCYRREAGEEQQVRRPGQGLVRGWD